MKKVIFFALLLLYLISGPYAQAQSWVSVKAGVGKYYFSASGIVSPFASVVMTTASSFMGSTVADKYGNFFIERVLVNEGFTDFCLEAVDIRRIGTSYTCFKTEPAKADFSKKDIFLPPTVGLSGRKVTPGSPILSSGYSMPLALVKVNMGHGLLVEARADINGYYKAEIRDLPVGSYELYATAKYQAKNSEKPTRSFKIESLGLLAAIPSWLWILLLVLLVLIVIILLIILWKRRRKKKTKIKRTSRLRDFFSWHA